MNKDTSKHSKMCADPSKKALARYAAVSWVVERMKDNHPDRSSLSIVLAAAASRDWNGYHFGTSTIERYYYRYKKYGFATLVEKPRADEGKYRKINQEQIDQLLERRRANPTMPITVLLGMMTDQGSDILSQMSISSIYRLFRHHGLDRISINNGSLDPLRGPQKAFEMPAVNMLWMTDMMYGPAIKTEDGKIIKTRLFALIDDHSRLCTGAQYFGSEGLDCFLAVLRSAILCRGIPEKIYTDQGKIYMSRHLAVICANVGMKLSHARPYHAWSKGKIERFFLTVQMQFQTRLTEEPVHSLDELNRRFNEWLENKYHSTVHSATEQTPAARFAAGVEGIRNPADSTELNALFMKREERSVRKDGCISVGTRLFEAPLNLRGMRVEVRFTIPLGEQIEIWHQGTLAGLGNPVNKHFNSTNFKKRKQ